MQRSFARWRPATVEPAAAYPPRAQVGAYLTEGFESLLRHAPRTVTIRLRELAVEAVRANGAAWDAWAGGAPVGTYDEVLIATGHERHGTADLDARRAARAAGVPRRAMARAGGGARQARTSRSAGSDSPSSIPPSR